MYQMRTIILVLLNLAMINSYPIVPAANPYINRRYVTPGVYGRDPASTGGMSCISLLDCDGGIGTCDRVRGFNDTVCICPEGRSNVDCSYRRIDSNSGLILIILGPLIIGYILFMAFTGIMLDVLLPMFFVHTICWILLVRHMRDPSRKFIVGCAILGLTIFDITLGIMVMKQHYTDNNGYEMY
jgi:hypothetical protein